VTAAERGKVLVVEGTEEVLARGAGSLVVVRRVYEVVLFERVEREVVELVLVGFGRTTLSVPRGSRIWLV
jgi:hypothetical protein